MGIRGIGDGVGVFIGVVDEVVIFVAFAFADVVDEFLGLGSQADHCWKIGIGRVFEVFEEEVVSRQFAFVGEEWTQGMAVVVIGYTQAGYVRDGCRDVEADYVGVCYATGVGYEVGISHEIGHADGWVIHPAFVAEAKFAVEVAVVAGVYDECVIGLSNGINFVEYPAQGIIDAAHGAYVVAHKGVVTFVVFEVVRAFAKGSGFAVARCAQGVGFGQFVVGIGMGMTRWWGEGAMRGFVPQADCPGAVVVFVEKLFDVIGEEVGVVSLMFDFLTVDDKDGVFVVPLTAETDPAFKAGFGIAAGQVNAFGSVVYFSKEARAISRFL